MPETKTKLENFYHEDYRDPFICPFHHCVTDQGWCWECTQETFGYEKAKQVYNSGKNPGCNNCCRESCQSCVQKPAIGIFLNG